jgi:hypothetical protein
MQEGDGITSAIKNWTAPTIDWVLEAFTNTTELVGLETGGPDDAPALTVNIPSSSDGFQNNDYVLKASVNQFPAQELNAYTFEYFVLGAEALLATDSTFAYSHQAGISIYRENPFYYYAEIVVYNYNTATVFPDTIDVLGFSAFGHDEGISVESKDDTVPLSLTQWAHVAVVQTGSSLKVFVGGQLFYEAESQYSSTLADAPETSTLQFRVRVKSIIDDFFNNNRTGTRPRVSGIRFTPRALYDSNFTPPSNITDFA